jgi:predicted carbohydrate-binding protein with CBM5 and CBM33 domain
VVEAQGQFQCGFRGCQAGVTGPKGFPEKGPKDGEIASGGGGRFPEMDEQSVTRWKKVDIPAGVSEMMVAWALELNPPIRTDVFRYFITRDGWTPTSPLPAKTSSRSQNSNFKGQFRRVL